VKSFQNAALAKKDVSPRPIGACVHGGKNRFVCDRVRAHETYFAISTDARERSILCAQLRSCSRFNEVADCHSIVKSFSIRSFVLRMMFQLDRSVLTIL
jgi:hypothetical protein